MIEEVLLSLYDSPSWFDKFKNNVHVDDYFNDFSTLGMSESELKLLRRLLKLKENASKISKFVDTFCSLEFLSRELGNGCELVPSETHSQFGFYQAALAEGLAEIMDGYRRTLCQIDGAVKDDVNKRNLIYLIAELQPYFSSLPVVVELIERLNFEDYRGCQLFHLLFNQSFCSIPSVETQIRKLRRKCLNVFSNQLIEWMSKGSVSDKYQEFLLFMDQEKNEAVERSKFRPPFISDFLFGKIAFIGEKVRMIRLDNGVCTYLKSNHEILETNHRWARSNF